jgi:hypothetical protein
MSMKKGFFDIFRKSKDWHAPASGRVGSSYRSFETIDELIQGTLIDETVSEWMGDKQSDGPELDRVLNCALEEGLISIDDVVAWLPFREAKTTAKTTSPDRITWKEAIKIDPWRSQQLERTAARVYGFKSVLICQMSTLVLADMLSSHADTLNWARLFEMGLAPVVEHGKAPQISGRITMVSKDPSNREIRNYVDKSTDLKVGLAYADAQVVTATQELISQNIPAIGAAVYVSRPALTKIASSTASHKRAA